MKYIDADKLNAALALHYAEITIPVITDEGGIESYFRRSEIHAIQKIIDSLQQEQPEWSEEDEEMLEYVIGDVNDAKELFATKEAIDLCDKEIAWLKSLRPSWKPTEDEERLINTSISFLKDFADKGYENAVECIDWLKSKLNGNSGK